MSKVIEGAVSGDWAFYELPQAPEMLNVRSPLDLKCSKSRAISIFLICDWWCLICQCEGSTRLYDRQDQYGFSIVIIVFTAVILVNRMSSKAKYIAAVCVLFSTCGSICQKFRFSESFHLYLFLYFPVCLYIIYAPVSLHLCWRTPCFVCPPPPLAWPASTNAVATRVVTTLTLWPQHRPQ